jgi:hypothetical protein
MKGLLDGAICAFHSHAGADDLRDLADRVASQLHVQADEVCRFLTRADRAVLGALPRLLYGRGTGVAWAPADDRCVAGEVLAGPSAGGSWTISGRIAVARVSQA